MKEEKSYLLGYKKAVNDMLDLVMEMRFNPSVKNPVLEAKKLIEREEEYVRDSKNKEGN